MQYNLRVAKYVLYLSTFQANALAGTCSTLFALHLWNI